MRRPSRQLRECRRAFAPRLVIMVKEPIAGRVKTRLARDVGIVRATQFFRFNIRFTVQRLSPDPRWQTILAVAPDTAIYNRMFAQKIARIPQGHGDLGQRLARVAKDAPPGPLIIIGADVPGIVSDDIAVGFRTLQRADAVFGPSGDGGYWLVGLNPKARQLPVFENVRWSSPHALADTKRNVAHLKCLEIERKDDIDRGSDLQSLRKKIGRLVVC